MKLRKVIWSNCHFERIILDIVIIWIFLRHKVLNRSFRLLCEWQTSGKIIEIRQYLDTYCNNKIWELRTTWTRIIAVKVLVKVVGFGLHFEGKGFADGISVDCGRWYSRMKELIYQLPNTEYCWGQSLERSIRSSVLDFLNPRCFSEIITQKVIRYTGLMFKEMSALNIYFLTYLYSWYLKAWNLVRTSKWA